MLSVNIERKHFFLFSKQELLYTVSLTLSLYKTKQIIQPNLKIKLMILIDMVS